MKKLYILPALALALNVGHSQTQLQPVDVVDQTIKLSGLGGEENLYVGFAEGDQIVFNFKEADGKELKSVDISEYPSTPKFSDFKTKEIVNKIINVNKKGIYQFHFSNSALGGRVCKIHIQRIPANESTKLFNTNVVWKDVFDTTYTIEQERYLVKSDTTIDKRADPLVKIHSTTSLSGSNTNTIEFTLPSNTRFWSYYIGVDQAGEQAFANATQKFSSSVVGTAIEASDPMAALALGGISYFTKLTEGNQVTYYFLDSENEALLKSGQPFSHIKKGTVMNDYGKMESPLAGTYYLRLVNNNYVESEQVVVHIVAICINQQWDTKPVKRMHVEKKNLPFIAD